MGFAAGGGSTVCACEERVVLVEVVAGIAGWAAAGVVEDTQAGVGAASTIARGLGTLVAGVGAFFGANGGVSVAFFGARGGCSEKSFVILFGVGLSTRTPAVLPAWLTGVVSLIYVAFSTIGGGG